MKTYLYPHGDNQERIELDVFDDDYPPHAKPKTPMKCSCGADLKVAGAGKSIGGYDYYTAKGICLGCNNWVGEIRVYVSTLFGLEEDERVFRSGLVL